MVGENLLDRIKKIRSGQKQQKTERKVRHLTHRPFSEKLRQKCARFGQDLRRILTLSVLGVTTLLPAKEASATLFGEVVKAGDKVEVLERNRQQTIDEIVNTKTSELQDSIVSNITDLQQDIKTAKKKGKRNQVVRNIFSKVYNRGGLPGNLNYCVAGAMYAQIECNDSILNQILPDPAKTAADYNFGSHPNVSCPYMREFFQNTLGKNYAERGDSNFNEFIKTLEAGDIITVRSSRNTTSGEHCVTCVGPVKDGKVRVSGFNNESTYNVPISKIVGAAKVIEQYRDVLAQRLEKDMDMYNYMAMVSGRYNASGVYKDLALNDLNVKKITPPVQVKTVQIDYRDKT